MMFRRKEKIILTKREKIQQMLDHPSTSEHEKDVCRRRLEEMGPEPERQEKDFAGHGSECMCFICTLRRAPNQPPSPDSDPGPQHNDDALYQCRMCEKEFYAYNLDGTPSQKNRDTWICNECEKLKKAAEESQSKRAYPRNDFTIRQCDSCSEVFETMGPNTTCIPCIRKQIMAFAKLMGDDLANDLEDILKARGII